MKILTTFRRQQQRKPWLKVKHEDPGSIVGDNNKELRGCKRPCPISNNYWRRVMAKELR